MSERIRLYLDEDAQRTDLIQALRARHIDIETVTEANLLGEDDEVHLRRATEQGNVVLTFNRGDFVRLHREWLATGQHHAGKIVSDQLGTGVVMRRLLRLIDSRSAAEMRDWLEFLSNWR